MKLIYIGKEYKDFVKEAERYGISRNVPLNAIGGMEWGETVLCAIHNKYPEALFEALGKEPDGTGTADLLCSFTFDRLFIRDPQLHNAVMARLQELGFISGIEEADDPIERDCGAYVVTSVTTVTVPLHQLVSLIRDMAKRLSVPAKVMIGGPVKDIYEEGEYIPHIKFSRGIMKWEDEKPIITKVKVIGVNNYQHFDTLEQKYQFKQESLKVFEAGSK